MSGNIPDWVPPEKVTEFQKWQAAILQQFYLAPFKGERRPARRLRRRLEASMALQSVKSIRGLHSPEVDPTPWGPFCKVDGERWPCRTARLLPPQEL